MRINHNIAALNTYRQFGAANTAQAKSMEKLSSGLRINKAGDDAAGLAISEKMRGQIRGLDMASKNAQDGISLISTAEGALNETHDILQRMRELAVQSGNDTNTVDDRKEIQKEINQLTSEINRIGNTTEFNTKKLLNGEMSSEKVTGTTSTTVTKAVSQDATLAYAQGAKFTGTGTAPTIISADGANTIDFSGKAGEMDWSKLDVTASAKLTLTKSGNDITVDFKGADTDGDKLVIDAEKMAFDGSKYTYNNNGIQFEISKADFDAMKDTDKFELELGTGGLEQTDVTTATVGTKNDWKTMTKPLATDKAAEFQGTGIKVDPANSQLLADVAQVKITGTGLDGANGNIKIELLKADGTSVVTMEQFDFAAAQTDGTFSYDNNGLSFKLDINKASAFEGTVKLQTETTTTKTDTKVDQSLKFQIGANENQSMSLGINDMRAAALGITGEGASYSSDANVTDGTNATNNEKALDVLTSTNAANAVTVIDKAIAAVSSERSKLGANQNRLEHTINNLGTSSENLTAAESRIRDVDMAKEMMNQTKNSILSQAAQAMLAQANQQPQGVLQLLR